MAQAYLLHHIFSTLYLFHHAPTTEYCEVSVVYTWDRRTDWELQFVSTSQERILLHITSQEKIKIQNSK